MNRRRILRATATLLGMIGVGFWIKWGRVGSPPASSTERERPPPARQEADSESTAAQPSSPMIRGVVWENNPRVQMPASHSELYDPSLPQWSEWKRRNQEDSHWEWKVRIDFYGKVVDYVTGQPIPGVEVFMTWTDLSAVGHSEATRFSDENGHFRLGAKNGKSLVVQEITKEGYQRSNVGSQFSFEYAGFWEPDYYLPDPDNPVVFRMRKKVEAERLLHLKGEIAWKVGDVRNVLPGGFGGLEIELLTNGTLKDKIWSAEVRVQGGGIQVTTEEFPVFAPEDGYQPALFLDRDTPKPTQWVGLHAGGEFYVKTADGRFGRLQLRMIPGKSHLYYLFYLNPNPGSRNLEFDPEKIARPQDVMNAAGGSP
jgi:hypothetical protein